MAPSLTPLEDLPRLLLEVVGAASAARCAVRPASGGFCLIEHVHHLADLEEEGFAVRLERLLTEKTPHLADFDGARIATERNYVARDALSGARRFAQARGTLVARFTTLTPVQWERAGTQEGVGRVTVAELPTRMAAHDGEHAGELAELLEELGLLAPLAAHLRALKNQRR